LLDPIWPLYLGRKAFVPGESVWLEDSLHADTTLFDGVKAYARLHPEGDAPRRLILEDEAGVEVRPDQPLSFAERKFALRRVRTSYV
jgi:hypothetical protein